MDEVERRLVARLRDLDLDAVQPGLRARSWLEFCSETGIDPARSTPASTAAGPVPLPARAAVIDVAAEPERPERLRFSRRPSAALRLRPLSS